MCLLLALIASHLALIAVGQVGPWPNCSQAHLPKQKLYEVNVLERFATDPAGSALISYQNGTSAFNFSFNAAWFPHPDSGRSNDRKGGLVVRVVECNPNHHECPAAKHPEWSNAGALAIVEGDLSSRIPRAGFVGYGNVVWPGVTPPRRNAESEWGAADPRIVYRPLTGDYYLTWDNCTKNCYPTRSTMLSTTKTPYDAASWVSHGALLPGEYTGGASILFQDGAGRLGYVSGSNSTNEGDSPGQLENSNVAPLSGGAMGHSQQGSSLSCPTHFAFVSDSNTAHAILLAESSDGIHWSLTKNASRRIFMEGRKDCWDQSGVAPGPQPERLSSGDYLFIYNIDTGFPYAGNPLGRCAVGWAILDGNDPTKIVARSNGPLLMALAPWEQCIRETYTCQETMVVFSTGLKPLGDDRFLVLYGGGDTDVGIAEIQVVARQLLHRGSCPCMHREASIAPTGQACAATSTYLSLVYGLWTHADIVAWCSSDFWCS